MRSRPSLSWAVVVASGLVASGLLLSPGIALAQPSQPAAPAVAAPAPSSAPAPATTGAPVDPAGPAGAPAGAEGPAAAPPGAAPTVGDGTGYTVRLRHLERSVSELKEQVFRTKARLQLLKETVLGGVIGASRAVIQHKNEMGASFRMIKVVYALDGVQIFSKADDSGRLSEMTQFDVYNGAIQPGSHTVSVQITYQGHGFGVFSYLKGYKFNVKGSNTFVAGEGRATQVTVVGFEKGGLTTAMEDKPTLEFRVNSLVGEGGAPTATGQK